MLLKSEDGTLAEKPTWRSHHSFCVTNNRGYCCHVVCQVVTTLTISLLNLLTPLLGERGVQSALSREETETQRLMVACPGSGSWLFKSCF